MDGAINSPPGFQKDITIEGDRKPTVVSED
jgi:hypothetical protein